MKHAFMTLLCAGALALTGATAMSAPVPTLKGAHKAMNLPCETCHGSSKICEVPQEEACFKCHGSREAIKKLTANLKPNPHFGHDETVSCFECHKEHQESTLLCNDCHQFKFKTP